MADFNPRMRGHVPQSKFSNAAKAARAANQSTRGERVEGRFDRLILTKNPMWVRLSPEQAYEQFLYHKELKKVIQTGTEEFPARPWFEHKTHYVVSTKRPHICTSGPHRDQPCRGCANRSRHYDMIAAREKSTNVKDEEARKNPPVQESVRYGMAVTALEKIFELPVIGKGGKVRTNKDGKDIMQFVPAPNTGFDPRKIKETDGTWGHNFHWAFGPVHLGHLTSIDADLWNYCASCAAALVATQFMCPECNQVAYEDDNGVTEADLRQLRETVMKCPHCGTEDNMVPALLCTGCDKPQQGDVLSFDLRLRQEPDPNDEKKSTIQLVEFRLPNYETIFATGPKSPFPKGTAERIYELVYGPLDIAKIYGPESMEAQSYAYPDDMKKTDPNYHVEKKKRKDAAPYGAGDGATDGSDTAGDQEQMSFGDDEAAT